MLSYLYHCNCCLIAPSPVSIVSHIIFLKPNFCNKFFTELIEKYKICSLPSIEGLFSFRKSEKEKTY